MSSVTLVSNQGQKFEVDRHVVAISKYMQPLLQNEETTEFTLNGVDDRALKLVVDYMNHYSLEPSIIPGTLENSNLKGILTDWDCEFLNSRENFESDTDLVEFSGLVEDLDIEPLNLILACKMACILMDHPIEQLMKIFPGFF
jgi:hypothetical protein